MKKSEQLLLKIYQEFYRQRSVLSEAPCMTLSEEQQTEKSFETQKAKNEIESLVAYLLGLKNINDKTWDELFQLVNKYYSQQLEWKKILLDFLEFQLEIDIEKNQQLQQSLLNEIQELLKKST